MSTVTNLSEPTEAEVEHLTALVAKARGAAPVTLARLLLDAGYRLVPEPEPVRYGECRACTAPIQLNEAGCLVEHEDQRRRSRPCVGGSMTPLRIVDPAEVVGADVR